MDAQEARLEAEAATQTLWDDLQKQLAEAAASGSFYLYYKLPKNQSHRAIPVNFAWRLYNLGYNADVKFSFFSSALKGIAIYWTRTYERKTEETPK